MTKTQKTNFTTGNIIKSIILFSIPIIVSELLQNLYNSVDSMIVGKKVGDAALAAVSVCSPIANLLVNFFNGMSVGNTVVVATCYGRGDKEGTASAVKYAYTFSVIIGIVVSVLGIILAPWLLDVSGCNEEIYGEAITYLRIYLAGLMFTVIYNCGTGILRAMGDSATPLYVLAITSVLNIVLDYLFVVSFHWGTAGVGIATIIAQGLSMILVSRLIHRSIGVSCIHIRETFTKGLPVIRSSLRIGFAAGMQNALIQFSNIFAWRYINVFDTSVSAGFGAAMKIDRFVILPCKAFGMSTTTYISQNLGAGDSTRAKRGVKYCFAVSAAVTFSLAAIVFMLRGRVMNLFTDEESVISIGKSVIVAFTFGYPAMVVREVLLGILRGCGFSNAPMMLSLIGMVGFRQIYLAIAMTIYHTVSVVYVGFPLAWYITAVLLLLYTWIIRRRLFARKT